MATRIIITVVFIFTGLYCSGQSRTVVKNNERAVAHLKEIEMRSRGVLGISAYCPETGQTLKLNAGVKFPMASTYKLPIAIVFLHQVNKGIHQLEDTILVTSAEISPGFSPLATHVLENGSGYYTKQEILKRMVSESDNTASDLILKLTGGASAVNAYLQRMGIREVRIDRYEKQICADVLGVDLDRLSSDWSIKKFDGLALAVEEDNRIKIFSDFMKDPRDTAKPEGMTELLKYILDRRLPEFIHYDELLAMLVNTNTGLSRIKGSLPEKVLVAHKTGTQYTIKGINGGTHDVGIITSPGGRHIVLSIFLKESKLDNSGRELVIAQASKLIYDAFMAVD